MYVAPHFYWCYCGSQVCELILKSIHHLLPSHPKDNPLSTVWTTFYDKHPRFGWNGVCHCALWESEQLDFGLAAGARLGNY